MQNFGQKASMVGVDAAPYFNRYCYDQNGNMVRRRLGIADVLPRASAGGDGQSYPDTQIVDTYLLTYDAENRLQEVSLNGDVVATYTYDGDGNRVKAVVGGVATVYVGNYYEREGNAVRKYYYADGVRVAMRTGGQTYYLLGDHLGGTNVTANSSGAELGRVLYRPRGETRVSTGTTPTASHGALQVSGKTAEGVQSGCTTSTPGTSILNFSGQIAATGGLVQAPGRLISV